MDDWFGFNPPPKPKIPDPQQTAATQEQFNIRQAELQQEYNLTQARYNQEYALQQAKYQQEYLIQQAETQAGYNLDALRTNISANRLDQNTPFMNVAYNPTGTDEYGNTTYGVDVNYSPEQQALLDMLQSNQRGVGEFGTSLVSDLASNPNYTGGIPDFTSMSEPMMARHLEMMNPYFEQQIDKLDADMRNQGLFPGMPGYDNAMRSLHQTHAESVGQFANQSASTVAGLYQQPFNIIQQIMGMTGPVGMNNLGIQSPPSANINAPTVGAPNVGNVNVGQTNVGGTNFAGITQDALNAALKQYEQEMGVYAGGIGALTGIFGTALGAPGGTVMGNLVGSGASGLANMLGLGGAAGTINSSLPLFRTTPPPRTT